MCSQPANRPIGPDLYQLLLTTLHKRLSWRIPLNDRKSGRTCGSWIHRFLVPNQASHPETNVRKKFMILANPKIVARHHRNPSDAHEITDSSTRDTLVDWHFNLWLTIFTWQQASFMWDTTCRVVSFVREHTSLVKGRGFFKNGSQGWARSNDIRVNSSALCQLSYLGFKNWCNWWATISQPSR